MRDKWRKHTILFFGVLAVTGIVTSCQKSEAVIEQEDTYSSGEVWPNSDEQADGVDSEELKAQITVTEHKVEQNLVSVHYPSISGMQDESFQELCNVFLKERSTEFIEDCRDNDTLEVSYEIATQTDDILSIVLRGALSMEGNTDTNNFVHTLNIDLKKEIILRLDDQTDVQVVAKTLLEDKKYQIYNIDGNAVENELKQEAEEYLAQYSVDSLVAELEAADYNPESTEQPYQYSYIKEGHLHYYLMVVPAMGDYVDLEIS